MTYQLETAQHPEKLRRVAIDPVSRVEGHGKVTILLDENNKRMMQEFIDDAVAAREAQLANRARNLPCADFPNKRAATPAECRSNEPYTPLGSNPWRGPPVPYDTPINDPRNITPPNKFPMIPPGADYDPGPPSVQLPPGVPALGARGRVDPHLGA